MARKTAGYRFPHATTQARKHACIMCPVIAKIAERAAAGDEPWGTAHRMPPVTGPEHQAEQIVDSLYLGRSCKKTAQIAGALSVSVRYLAPDGTESKTPVRQDAGYILTVRVFTRRAGQIEVIRRADAGEPLDYNPLKGLV